METPIEKPLEAGDWTEVTLVKRVEMGWYCEHSNGKEGMVIISRFSSWKKVLPLKAGQVLEVQLLRADHEKGFYDFIWCPDPEYD